MTTSDSARPAAGAPAQPARLTVVTARLLAPTGPSWHALVTALAEIQPDVAVLQETGVSEPYATWANLRRAAAQLGMRPALSSAAGMSGSAARYVAVLAADRVGAENPSAAPAGPRLWCAALLDVPGLDQPLRACSACLPAGPAARRAAASDLADYAGGHASHGNHVLAGGGWSSYLRDGAPDPEASVPPLVRAARWACGTDGRWQPDCGPDELLTAAGLVSISAPGAARAASGEQLDRLYATPSLAAALISARPVAAGGHSGVTAVFDLARIRGPGQPGPAASAGRSAAP
jgi:hypothetical protein